MKNQNASNRQSATTPQAETRAAPPRAWQRMLSGRRLDLLDPLPTDIEIDDIASQQLTDAITAALFGVVQSRVRAMQERMHRVVCIDLRHTQRSCHFEPHAVVDRRCGKRGTETLGLSHGGVDFG